MNKELSSKITNANVLFTILIVCLHARPNDQGVYQVIGTIGDAAVPSFFVISSYLYFASFCWKEAGKSYLSKLKKRIWSLLIPYLIFCTIGFLAMTIKYFLKHEQLPYDIFSFQSVVGYWVLGKGNPPLWYLTSLFGFVLFAPIVGYLVRFSKLSFLLIPLSVFVCSSLSYFNILFWMPALLLGAYCYYWEEVVTAILKKWGTSLMIVAILLLILFCSFFYGLNNRNVYYVYRMVVPVIFIVIYYKSNICPPPFVDKLKHYTLFIYCIHSVILIYISPMTKLMINGVGYIFSIIATIVISFFVGYCMKRYIPKIWNLITGGR